MKTQVVVTKIIEIQHDDNWTNKDLEELAKHVTTNEDLDEWDIKQSKIKEVFSYYTVYEK